MSQLGLVINKSALMLLFLSLRDLFDTSKENLVIKEDQNRSIELVGATSVTVATVAETLHLLEVRVQRWLEFSAVDYKVNQI